MSDFIPQPAIRPLPNTSGNAVLTEDYVIGLPISGRTLSVKAGFVTDGASIPEPAWSILDSYPFDPDILGPSIVHDALYSAELMQRGECDKEFEELLRRNSSKGDSVHWMFYEAVRLGGWAVWNRHTPDTIAQSREFCSLSS